MFLEFIRQISNLPYFSTVSFGVLAMILVGTSWCLIGLVMGSAPKKGIDTGLILLIGGLVSIIVSSCISFTTPISVSSSYKMTIFTLGMLFTSGFLNFFMLKLMSLAMQKGPNGIIWSIIQSAMVVNFIVGLLFFNAEFTVFKLLGIILLVFAIIGFGVAKDNSQKSCGNWKIITFCAFAICALQQTINTMPAYFPESRQTSSILCTLATSSGTVSASIIFMLFTLPKEKINNIKQNIQNPLLWKYVFALQFFSLLFAYTLFYPGLFTMGKHGLGMVCFPMMVGSCILSFTLVGILILKEKIKPLQLFALIMCLSGLVFLAMK